MKLSKLSKAYTKRNGVWVENHKLELDYGKYVETQKQMGFDWVAMEDFINGFVF